MNKKAIALGVAVAMAAAVGCGATETAKDDEPGRIRLITEHGIDLSTYCQVIVDEETGVEYLWIDGHKAGGVAVLMNPDGTPKIAEGYETAE